MILHIDRPIYLGEVCLPPVWNQQGLLSCMACTICDAIWRELTRENYISTGDEFILSPMFLYYNARKRIGHENHNVAVCPSDVMDAVREQGVCLEKHWPYDLGRFRERPPSHVYEAAQMYRCIEFEQVAQSLDQIKQLLNKGIPTCFCIRLFPSNFRHFNVGGIALTGRIKMPEAHESPIFNHAMLIVGYDEPSASFIVRNSFGKNWGDQGYAAISQNYLLDSRNAYAFWRVKRVTIPVNL